MAGAGLEQPGSEPMRARTRRRVAERAGVAGEPRVQAGGDRPSRRARRAASIRSAMSSAVAAAPASTRRIEPNALPARVVVDDDHGRTVLARLAIGLEQSRGAPTVPVSNVITAAGAGSVGADRRDEQQLPAGQEVEAGRHPERERSRVEADVGARRPAARMANARASAEPSASASGWTWPRHSTHPSPAMASLMTSSTPAWSTSTGRRARAKDGAAL